VISGAADTLSRSSEFNPKSQNSLYQANLFSDRIFETSDRIALYFPDKQNLLYKSMFWLLVASLGFTLIIISTFIFSIQVIIRQKKISEVKSDFINNMTHEFKTPIATISLAADSIVNPRVMADPERIHYYTRVIKEENKRMNNQVESVLQMALLDKMDFSLNLQALDVHDLITQAIQNISLQIEKRNGSISFDLEALDSTALVDEVHFLNVLFNLLDNANKYSPQNPDINIKTTNLEGKLLIKVSDKGMGMDKETKGRIFEKFYRKSTGNIHNVKGFGLGLSYVKAIVAATNGEIWVESEPEKGSCFTIEIPVYHGN
jgi:two-component system phosphate regulon sensor histidine kinase PhoR